MAKASVFITTETSLKATSSKEKGILDASLRVTATLLPVPRKTAEWMGLELKSVLTAALQMLFIAMVNELMARASPTDTKCFTMRFRDRITTSCASLN